MRDLKSKKIAAAIILLLLVLQTACSNTGVEAFKTHTLENNASTRTEHPENIEQPIRLKFGMWESKTDIEFWTEKVKQYSEIKPNVVVEVETIPENNGQYLKVRLAANDLPDLFYLKPAHLPIYNASLLSLDELDATSRNKYPAKLDGHVLGLPLVSFSEYVFYHPSIFHEVGVEVPQTRGQFINVLEKIKKHGKYIPIAVGGKEDWTFYPFMEFGPPIIAENNHYLTDLTKNEKPFGAASPFDQAAKLLKAIADNEYAGTDALEIGFDQAKQKFQSNEAAMIALGQWYYSDHMSKVNSDEDLDAFALPWRTTENEVLRAITMPDQYMAISKNSPNAKEAIAFMEWMFSKDVYQAYINNSQNSSTVTDVMSFLPFFDKVNKAHPFHPFMYDEIDEKYVKMKNNAHYDEKKIGQEIFAGAQMTEIERKLNDNWTKAMKAVK